ncbi:protein kinase domain-containing protein [Schlesneria sp. DSM 10557]|uniref:protein kinase domain-containing protein n=1 Tax=Schlesneria sp. DSM 10557 TaxID=3044399 RepID=UPI00359F247A
MMNISLEKLEELLAEGDPSQVQWLNETVKRMGTGQTAPDPHRIIEEMLKARIITPLQSQFLLEGRNLLMGHYVFWEKIGEGGMGTVYSARHRLMGRMVALKIIRPDRFKAAGTIDRFLREIRLASRLHHPNVVTSYDAGECEGSLYLVMELVSGIDLKRRIQTSGLMSVPVALGIIRQVATGLAYLHSEKLVHRDIKPSNLMLDRSGVVKILDLGLSRMIEWTDTAQGDPCYDITGTGIVTGSVDFMPPEQFVNPREVDARADIYSLGCTLYWLLTGKPPFPGNSVGEIVVAHREHAIPRLQDTLKDVPLGLDSLLAAMLSKDRKTRLMDAQAVIEGIDTLEVLSPPETGHSFAVRRPLLSDETQEVTSEGLRTLSRSATQTLHECETVTEGLPETPSRRNVIFGSLIGVTLLAVTLMAKGFLAERLTDAPDKGEARDKGRIDTDEGDSSGMLGHHGPIATLAELPVWPVGAPEKAVAPFDSDTAKSHQEAWANYLGVPVEFTNSLGMSFRLIPPGEFMMGATEDEIEEWTRNWPANTADRLAVAKSAGPQHWVIISKPFYIGTHEVTQQEFEKVLKKNPSMFPSKMIVPDGSESQDMGLPVEYVTWGDCDQFCRLLSEREADQFRKYRLPTEAEWEFVCRAGTTTRTWLTDTDALQVLGPNFDLASTQPVGSLAANPFGIHDMLGNVWEWVYDWWDVDFYQQHSSGPAIDPIGPLKGTRKCLRGGSWGQDLTRLRSANRYCEPPDAKNAGFGFRVALPVNFKR